MAKIRYEKAFTILNKMLSGDTALDFKKAVFVTENAYLANILTYDEFNKPIRYLSDICKKLMESRELLYDLSDKNEVKKCASIFTVITDSIQIYTSKDSFYYHTPFTYDFEDFTGDKDWSKMFVTKLLDSHKGNCHSLPFLYKILAQELGIKTQLALAPNHIYIKHHNQQIGWYNTELTSAVFPIDAWLMASGYIHLTAIKNGVYMDTLSEKQSIALCMIDLAKGYEKKVGMLFDGGKFMTECCETALKYYPNYINGLLLQVEVQKQQLDAMYVRFNVDNTQHLLKFAEPKELFSTMENNYAKIHNLGYRKMPDEMYLSWLTSLKTEKDKYANKKISQLSKTKH